MRTESVEIYSNATNSAVIRHPARKFPGILVQGDTLHSMKKGAERALANLDIEKNEEAYFEVKDLHDWLTALTHHYKSTLLEHEMTLPFHDS